MSRLAAWIVVASALAAPDATYAQDSAGQQSQTLDRPLVEVGVGGSILYRGGTMPYIEGQLDSRVGVRLSQRWSLEGLVHLTPHGGGKYDGIHRAQVVWRIGGGAVQPFLALGAAGEYSRWTWPEYRYADPDTGEPRVIAGGSRFDIDPPWYPTVSLGFEKVLTSHLALRAEATVALGINDYGIATAVQPSIGVSIPIGGYRRRQR